MTQYIEDFLPPIQSAGLNTQKNTALGGTLTVTGASTFTGAATFSGGQTITGTITSTSGHVALNATATTSGGYPTPGFAQGSGLYGIYFGAGVPNITAPQGSLYQRVDGNTTSTRLYISTGAATSWVTVTTGA